VVGVLIIALGLLLTAGNFGWPYSGPILSYWPLGVVLVGAVMFWRTSERGGRLSGGLVLLVGIWLTAIRLLGSSPSVAHVWPLLLMAGGVAMIARAWRRDASTREISDQTFSDFAIWSGSERRISSAAFRRAELTAVMGGIEIDLRQASTPGEAVVDVFVMWGGIVIRVPPDWSVSNQVVAVMGGASDKSTGTRDAQHRLIIRGFVLMGGIEVKT
jgi:predicted membrane protein